MSIFDTDDIDGTYWQHGIYTDALSLTAE